MAKNYREDTVKILTHDGRRMKISAVDYQRNIAKWSKKGKIISTQHGNLTKEDEAFHKNQLNMEDEKKDSPKRERMFGDKQRFADANAVKPTLALAEGISEQVAEVEEETHVGGANEAPEDNPSPLPQDPEKVVVDPNWPALKWAKRRAYVKQITGTSPKTKAEAESLMAPYLS